MKVNELQEQINLQEKGLRDKVASLAAAGALAMSPASAHHTQQQQNPPAYTQQVQQVQQDTHRHKDKPFYKVGAAYKSHGKTYQPKFEPEYNKVGIASWYGPGFHGKKTANNDVFDTNSMMAASPTLPLPSKVWVTNLQNGKKIMVTVTDRGPYAKNRIIDLSKKAAEELGYLHKGTAKVKVEYDKEATEKYLKDVGLYAQYTKVNKLENKPQE